jgi:undecaprenyl-diphosphatase
VRLHRIGRLARQEWRVLAVLLLIVAAIWVFVEVADEVVEGETHALDTRLILLLRTPGDPADPIGPRWLEEAARDFTGLGSVAVLVFVTLAAVVYLALLGRRGAALTMLLGVAGGPVLSSVLKFACERPRPDLVPHGAFVSSWSFPSGHSTMSAVVYLTLGALLARVRVKRRLKFYVLALAILLTVLVGVTRVYLGVHWPSDVLAGWCVGAAWAMLCWLAMLWLQRRGAVGAAEDDEEEG